MAQEHAITLDTYVHQACSALNTIRILKHFEIPDPPPHPLNQPLPPLTYSVAVSHCC